MMFYGNMESSEVTAFIAIDQSAAFDTMDHRILLDVLQHHFGVTGIPRKWFQSYLSPRQFQVNIGKAYSELIDWEFSVPQGSCVGPILFLLYARTIAEVILPPLDIHGYADDHGFKGKFRAEWNDNKIELSTIKKLESCLDSIKTWMDVKRLKMNSSKTDFILFRSTWSLQKCTTNSINANDVEVKCSGCIRYLGALLDSHLNIAQHITAKCRTAMVNLFKIKQIKHMLTRETCQTIVFGLGLLHLDYSNAILANLPANAISEMQRVQNIASHIVLQDEQDLSTTKCLQKLHWIPIKQLIKCKMLTLVYKCLNEQAPSYLHNLLTVNPISDWSIHSNSKCKQLIVPFTKRRTFADRSFSVVGLKYWNELPNELCMLFNLESFHRTLKTHFFHEAHN